nr:hypothetical protein [Tanacetum cinerariifolium]
MSRDVLTVGSTMRIPLLYQGEYSQWVKRFMKYLEEQTDGEAMINLIKNGDQPLPYVTQVSIAGTSSTKQPPLKDKSMYNKTAKDLWDALARHMLSFEYGEQDRKAAVLYEYETFKANEGELLLDTCIRYLQVINDLKKLCNNDETEQELNQGDVNDAMGSKKKIVVITSYPLALIAEMKNLSKSKEKVVVSLDSFESKADDFSELKKITALLAKAFNRRKFYSKPTNNNLRTSSSYQSANKEQEFVKTDTKKVEKKDDEKKRDISRTVHMIMPLKDNLYNGQKGIGFENPRYFKKAKDLRPTLSDENVIGLGYTLMFLTHSDEASEIKKFKRSRENKIEFVYDYGNLNASYVNEKINLEDDYFQEIINPDFKKIDSPFQQTSSLKPYVPNVILEKIIIDLEDEVVSLLKKEKENLETIESLKSKECDKEENPKVIAPGMFKLNVSQCVSPISMSKSSRDSKNVEIKLKRKRHLDTFSSFRRPKNSGVIWKKKGSSNTSNVGETSSASMCNDAMNVSCNSRMNDLLDDNNFFIFDDVNVRISPVSKMPFRKKASCSMHIVQICHWIIDSGCSKHMTGNRALLTNFVEKFLETVRFGNNDFVVIAGYGDVVIDGVDLLIGDRSSNLYTIALNEVASNSSTCLLAKASSSQSWLWHQRLSHLKFATINNLEKNNLVQ